MSDRGFPLCSQFYSIPSLGTIRLFSFLISEFFKIWRKIQCKRKTNTGMNLKGNQKLRDHEARTGGEKKKS